jgi:hypothetical protein
VLNFLPEKSRSFESPVDGFLLEFEDPEVADPVPGLIPLSEKRRFIGGGVHWLKEEFA